MFGSIVGVFGKALGGTIINATNVSGILNINLSTPLGSSILTQSMSGSANILSASYIYKPGIIITTHVNTSLIDAVYSVVGDDRSSTFDYRDYFDEKVGTSYDTHRSTYAGANDGISWEIQMFGGNDIVFGTPRGDEISGGDGNDNLKGDLGNDLIWGDDGNDIIYGDGLDDLASHDTLYGGEGSDTIYGGNGNDDLYGNTESDRLSGGGGNDYLSGYTGNDSLYGGTGADDLLGSTGNDSLAGGDGKDTLNGGSGDDTFVFTSFGSSNFDTIEDFSVSEDVIELQKSGFSAISGTGVLTAAQFYKSSAGAAHDSSDRVIYETDTGKLFYDPDGNGSAAAQQIAKLSANLAIDNGDFMIVA